MTHEPFNLKIARNLAGHYQYLLGRPLVAEMPRYGLIECVCPAPYDSEFQWIFMHYYSRCPDDALALSFYKGTDFDVLLIARAQADPDACSCQDLRSYLAHTGGLNLLR
jgi:hypothetical protein